MLQLMTNAERRQVNWVYNELIALRRRVVASDEGFGCEMAYRLVDRLIDDVHEILMMSKSESASGAARIVAERRKP